MPVQRMSDSIVEEEDVETLRSLTMRALRLALVVIDPNEIDEDHPDEPVNAWNEAYQTLRFLALDTKTPLMN
ncbi:MAG: hypothetical protein U0136_11595 [Bdellovibrionota bacterium]